MWLSCLSFILCIRRLPVPFPVGAHAQVVITSRGACRKQLINVFLNASLTKKKIKKKSINKNKFQKKKKRKGRGTRQDFRLILKLENPLEGLLKIWVSGPQLLEFVVA